MDNIYHYVVSLPDGIKAFTMPCMDGYTVYTDSKLTMESQREAFRHEMWHILNGDFERSDVQEIEYVAHEENRR